MRHQLKNWYFDVSGDSNPDFDVYRDFLQSFRNFIKCPANSMGASGSSNLALVGEGFYGGRVSVSGISLITKAPNEAIDNNDAFNRGDGLIVLSSSGDVYHLFMTNMDAKFYREFIRGEKVIQLGYAASL